METWEGKSFSITDPKGVNTVIYQVIKTPKALAKEYPKYALERLESVDELHGDMKRKTFYIDFPSANQDELVILSFGKDRVVVNTAILEGNKVSISKKPMPLRCNSIYSEYATEIKDFKYTPNLKRPICVIDPETTEEIKPVLYFDEKTNEIKGKCKLKPYKSYFAFEIRDKKDN